MVVLVILVFAFGKYFINISSFTRRCFTMKYICCVGCWCNFDVHFGIQALACVWCILYYKLVHRILIEIKHGYQKAGVKLKSYCTFIDFTFTTFIRDDSHMIGNKTVLIYYKEITLETLPTLTSMFKNLKSHLTHLSHCLNTFCNVNKSWRFTNILFTTAKQINRC